MKGGQILPSFHRSSTFSLPRLSCSQFYSDLGNRDIFCQGWGISQGTGAPELVNRGTCGHRAWEGQVENGFLATPASRLKKAYPACWRWNLVGDSRAVECIHALYGVCVTAWEGCTGTMSLLWTGNQLVHPDSKKIPEREHISQLQPAFPLLMAVRGVLRVELGVTRDFALPTGGVQSSLIPQAPLEL